MFIGVRARVIRYQAAAVLYIRVYKKKTRRANCFGVGKCIVRSNWPVAAYVYCGLCEFSFSRRLDSLSM